MGLALALFEPDRPHNLGAALRLAACMGLPLDLIEPAGFRSTTGASARARSIGRPGRTGRGMSISPPSWRCGAARGGVWSC
jgi:hypothetical protein